MPSEQEIIDFTDRKNIIDSSIGIERENQELKHNIEENGMLFKYDLPIENRPIEFLNKTQLINVEGQESTPVQNLFETL